MILELLKHPDYLRGLLVLQRKPLRFTQLQKSLGLNPAQVDRALNFLRKGLYITPRTRPEKTRIVVEYQLSRRGKAFLGSFNVFHSALQRHQSDLGLTEIARFKELLRV